MNKIKKTIAIILCLVMAIGSLAYAEEVKLISAPATDYSGHWAENTIQKWMDDGKVSGYTDGSYKPDNNITRAEFVKLVNGTIDFDTKGTVAYKDVTSADWFYDYVGIAQEIGYILGYSADKFGPNDYITREQAASILARIQYLNNNAAGADKFNDEDNISSWAKEAVGAASEAGFISGYNDGSFKPSNNLTRAEAITMLDNVLVNSKNVVVYNAGSEVKDAIVEGDLIIAKTVGDGEVHLTNLEIKGGVKVLGGGMNSVYFNNVQVAKVEVGKDKVRLVFADGSSVEQLIAGSEVILENSDGTIAKVTITGDNKVTLTGNFGEVTVVGNGNIVLNDAVITTLVVNQPITIEGTGTITTLEANADDIKFESKVKITKTVEGEGVTKSPEVVVETPSNGGPSDPVPTDYNYKFTVTASVTKGDIEKTFQYDSFNQYKGSTLFTSVLGSEINYVKGKLADPNSLIYEAASGKLETLNDLIDEVESVIVDGNEVYNNNGSNVTVDWSLLNNTSIILTDDQKSELTDRDITIDDINFLLGLYNSSTIYNNLNTAGNNLLGEEAVELKIIEGIEPNVNIYLLDAQMYKSFLDDVLNDLLSNDKLVDIDEMSYTYDSGEFGISLKIDLQQLD
ncbi:MAG: S-layer homology domain-containing protein [Sedimentibacter sp.]